MLSKTALLVILKLVLAIKLFNCQTHPSSITTTLPNIKSKNCTQYSTQDNYWATYEAEPKFCYHISFAYAQLTYHQAYDYCHSRNATLASIHSSTLNYLLSHRDYGSGTQYSTIYWIGLNQLSRRGIYQWSDNSPLDFINYANHTISGDNIPDDPLNQDRCIGIISLIKDSVINRKDIGMWYRDDCNVPHRYICQKEFNTSIAPTPTPIPPGNCPPDWYQFANEKCIKYVKGSMNFTEAKTKCAHLNGDVVSIHSELEQNFIAAIIGGHETAYIGFRDPVVRSWKWVDQSKVNYTNWGYQKISATYDLRFCAIIVTNVTQPGSWLRVECDRNYSVVCERDKDPTLLIPGLTFESNKCKIPGFEHFIQYRNSCYSVVDNSSANFYGAESHCQSMNGSHLLSIVDPFEHSFLKYYISQYGKSDIYWIGLQSGVVSDKNVSQIFEWTDQWPIYYTYWDKNEPQFAGIPQAECVALQKSNSTWKTTLCDSSFAYICKTTSDPLPKMDSDKTGVCPQLNNVSDKSLAWVDIDKRSQHCYWFSVERKGPLSTGVQTWSDASFHCRRRNGTLLSIHSNHNLMLLRTKLTQTGSVDTLSASDVSNNTWIGLIKEPLSGKYIWEDGSPLDYTNWDPNENIVIQSTDLNDDSGHQCVEIDSSDLTWKQQSCSGSKRNYFICETKKIFTKSSVSPLMSTTHKISLSTTTPINTTKIKTGYLTSQTTTQLISTTGTTKTDDRNKGLSSGAKAGIAFGIIGGIIVLVGITYLLLKKLRPNSRVVTVLENSVYRNDKKHEPSVRWSKNT